MNEFDAVLSENEKILWQGRPVKGPYFTSVCVWLPFPFLFGLAFMVISLVMFHGWAGLLMPHFWVGLLIMVGPITLATLIYMYTVFAITNKRVLVQCNVYNRSIQSIEYDRISNITVNVNYWDRYFKQNTGTINFTETGGGQQSECSFYHIIDPYTVFKLLQKTQLDVKTDIQYPNAQRPAENPGYQTAYDKDKA